MSIKASAPHAASPVLTRNLGFWQAVAVVIGGIIGVSIFFVPSAVADSIGSPGITLGVWVLAGALSAAAALSFAELAGAIPETGGTYVQLRRAYGSDLLAFCFVWMMCFGYGSAAVAVVATMAASYLVPLFSSTGDVFAVRGTAVVLIALIAAINIMSVRQSGLVQAALTALKALILLAVIVVPFILLQPDLAAFDISPLPPAGNKGLLASVAESLIVCLFAYNGAIFVVQLAGEVREPEKNVPKAIAVGIGVVFVFYVLINLTYILFIPFETLRHSERVAADLVGLALGPYAMVAVSAAIVASALAVLNAQLLSYPRIVFALARDGLFVRSFAVVHPRLGTPWAAILLIAVCASIYAVSGSYRDILTAVAFVIHMFVTLAVAEVIVLRIREPDLPRPYRVWGYPFTPALFVAVSGLYLGTLLVTKFSQVMIGILIVALGIPIYWCQRRWSAVHDKISTAPKS